MAKGFAGHVGGQTVEDQITTGGTRGDGAIIGIEGHTSDLFFMVLGETINERLKRAQAEN